MEEVGEAMGVYINFADHDGGVNVLQMDSNLWSLELRV